MGQYGGTVHSHWVTSQLHIWAIAALLTSPSLVAGCAITPPLPTTRQLLYLEMSRDTSAKNEPRNTPIHVTELVIIYLEIHSPYISKAISRIFSWSIVKCFEPRKCFWDSVDMTQLSSFFCIQELAFPLLSLSWHLFYCHFYLYSPCRSDILHCSFYIS